jgi:lipoprotein-anchoring transpeptidase ErfK/SrfK
MLRYSLLLPIFVASLAVAQTAAPGPPLLPIKRALPIGGDEDVAVPATTPDPVPAAPTAPAPQPIKRALPIGGDDDVAMPASPPGPAPAVPTVVRPIRRALPLESEEGKVAPAAATPSSALPAKSGPVVIRPKPVVTPAKPPAATPPPLPAKPKPVVIVPKPPETPAKPPSAAPPEVKPVKPALAVAGEDADIPITPEKPQVAANEKPTGADAVRLQIFLDEACFGPGVIDGKPGRFTELAVRSWNEVHGYPLDDWVAVVAAARKAVPHPFATAVVPDWVKDWVNTKLPTSRASQAKLKRMSYRSIEELMSERYHCDVPYLIELNGSKKIYNLKARDSLVVPNVQAFRIESIKGTAYQADEALSERHAVVDTRINQIRIFEAAPAALRVVEEATPVTTAAAAPKPPVREANLGLIASFPITPGRPQFIKLGTWELRSCVELPVWRYDQQLLDTGKRSSDAMDIPAGPNNPVGVIWNGLSKPGIGLHGTSNPETIGRARSAGCIRLANWDAIRLPTLIRPGTTVEIR